MRERVVIVSRHVPDTIGTAAGRALAALRSGLIAAGHRVTVHSWSPEPVTGAAAAGCHQHLVPSIRGPGGRLHALIAPRSDARRLEVDVSGYEVVLADDPLSWPAVQGDPDAIASVHHSFRLDAVAIGRRDAALVQDLRFERWVARRVVPGRLEVFSQRVAGAIGASGARIVPIAHAFPETPLAPVDAPVAALVANFAWGPNMVALDRLLTAWPTVRARVPAARLLLAGRGEPAVGTMSGVRWLGEVADSRDVLADACAVAFACPGSSGPKVKSLEAIAEGRQLVTTRAGLEGIAVTSVPSSGSWTERLTATLADPSAAIGRAEAARSEAIRTHAPAAAAAIRMAGWREAAGARAR